MCHGGKPPVKEEKKKESPANWSSVIMYLYFKKSQWPFCRVVFRCSCEEDAWLNTMVANMKWNTEAASCRSRFVLMLPRCVQQYHAASAAHFLHSRNQSREAPTPVRTFHFILGTTLRRPFFVNATPTACAYLACLYRRSCETLSPPALALNEVSLSRCHCLARVADGKPG